MRSREEVITEMIKVADALEKPNLKPEQIARGKSRYDELEEELTQIIDSDRRAEEARKQDEAQRQKERYSPEVREAIDKTWAKLDPEGKRRKS